jgi:hypothetical protein
VTEDIERRNVPYTISVTLAYRGSAVSPISGKTLVAFADTVEEARQRVDLQILRECEERGLTIEGRYDPGEPT